MSENKSKMLHQIWLIIEETALIKNQKCQRVYTLKTKTTSMH